MSIGTSPSATGRPEVAQRPRDLGICPAPKSLADTAATVKAEVDYRGAAVREAGIEVK